MSDQLNFTDQVVIVTGGGGGLGKAYADFFASRGANVLINDLGRDAADAAVAGINALQGGRAVANYDSVTEGGKIVAQAFDKWGRVDVSLPQLAATAWTDAATSDPHQQRRYPARQILQGDDRQGMGHYSRRPHQGSLRLLEGCLAHYAKAEIRSNHQRKSVTSFVNLARELIPVIHRPPLLLESTVTSVK